MHHGPFPAIRNVSVVDQFGASTVDVRVPKRICNPADKNGEDPSAPSDPNHLAVYKIKQHEPFGGVFNQIIVNQFGSIEADIIKPEFLFVPSAKDLAVQPPPPMNPPLDHFKCYRMRHARTQVANVAITDQFGSLNLNVRRPLRLCVAANKNNEGVFDPTSVLTCYQTKLAPGTIPTTAPPSVFVTNQFGPQRFDTFRPVEFCVPSVLM